ncbi:WhiB family transcriptional regulator, partial [Streptomyces sp. NPDC050738]|uniref:WhiB family transcriptional regulator n=1 Tax=Streptomyces sp. NPDC050738 TaxID=3154744 RepID=UPI00343AB2B8
MTDEVDWSQALCCGDDGDRWFNEGKTSDEAVADSAYAKRQCGFCPIFDDCLVDAMASEDGKPADSRHGIRAGLTGKQRYRRA